jgi:hypothetical protein
MGRCAELQDPHGQINGYASIEFSTVDYLQLQRVRTFLQQKIDAPFNRFDVIAAPGEGDTPILLRRRPKRKRTRDRQTAASPMRSPVCAAFRPSRCPAASPARICRSAFSSSDVR